MGRKRNFKASVDVVLLLHCCVRQESEDTESFILMCL